MGHSTNSPGYVKYGTDRHNDNDKVCSHYEENIIIKYIPDPA